MKFHVQAQVMADSAFNSAIWTVHASKVYIHFNSELQRINITHGVPMSVLISAPFCGFRETDFHETIVT